MGKRPDKDYMHYLAESVVKGAITYDEAVASLDTYEGGLNYSLHSGRQLSKSNKIIRLNRRIKSLKTIS